MFLSHCLERLRLAIPIAFLSCIPTSATAEDWPQWRGAHRDGVWSETRIVRTFPSGGLMTVWRAPVGLGFSSPVVAHGRVYVTDSQLERPKVWERVHCFNETTGQSLWTYSNAVTYPEWAFTPGSEAMPNSTPIATADVVYAGGALGHRLFCIETSHGNLLWEKDLAQQYQIEETCMISASPLIESNLLILLLGGKPNAGVVAFDRTSGREVWRALDESAAHSSPIVIDTGGTRQLIVWTLQSVSSLDPRNGKVLWRERFPNGSSSVVATPVFSKNCLLISGLLFQVDPDKPAASVLWPATAKGRILSSTSTPLLQGDFIYSADSSGKLLCLEINTGKRVWETNGITDPKGAASTTIHLTTQGDSVLLFNDLGQLIRGKLTGQGYQELSRVQLIEPTYPFSGRKLTWAPPAYANGHVYARNDKEVICASLAAE